MASASVISILEKMMGKDKDHRYMATSDLLNELNKDGFKADADLEVKLTNTIIQQLEDPSGDVSGLAMKCLPPIVKKVSEVRVLQMANKLCEKLLNGKGQHRDICGIALKTVVSEITSLAQRLQDTLGPQLIKGITSSACPKLIVRPREREENVKGGHHTTLVVVKFTVQAKTIFVCATDSMLTSTTSGHVRTDATKMIQLNRNIVVLTGGFQDLAKKVQSILRSFAEKPKNDRKNHLDILNESKRAIVIKLERELRKDPVYLDEDDEYICLVSGLIVDKSKMKHAVLGFEIFVTKEEDYENIHFTEIFHNERIVKVGAEKAFLCSAEHDNLTAATGEVFDMMVEECRTNECSGGRCDLFSGSADMEWSPSSQHMGLEKGKERGTEKGKRGKKRKKQQKDGKGERKRKRTKKNKRKKKRESRGRQ